MNTAALRSIAQISSDVYDERVERDWYRRVMLKLADAREIRSHSEFLSEVDSELDAVIMQLEQLRTAGGLSGFSVKRGLSMLNELRGLLEIAKTAHEVNVAFQKLDAVRDIVDDAIHTIAERE